MASRPLLAKLDVAARWMVAVLAVYSVVRLVLLFGHGIGPAEGLIDLFSTIGVVGLGVFLNPLLARPPHKDGNKLFGSVRDVVLLCAAVMAVVGGLATVALQMFG
jgi:hypothetical protein